MTQKENIYTIPNFLSFYRILAFPLIIWFISTGNEGYFALFLCINLITDILDGFIARNFNQQTRLGARMDSLADIGTYICAFFGIYQFKLEEFGSDILFMWVFLGFFVLANLVSFIKFGKWPSFHLYSVKASGYLQGIFFLILFVWYYEPILFYAAMITGCLALTEEIILLLLLPAMKSDIKGMYWVMRKGRKE